MISVILINLLAARTALGQVDSCQNTCSPYNDILVSCESDANDNSVYLNCVCNDPNFKTTNAACVACEGPGSAPAQFQKNCQNVPPDSTVACNSFSLILSGCGDPSTSGFADCVCSGAYDIQYFNTFNEAFNDCVLCENGGGIAADWEQTCCKNTGNCNGMSVAGSSGAGSTTVPATSLASATTATSTSSFAPSSGGATSLLVGSSLTENLVKFLVSQIGVLIAFV